MSNAQKWIVVFSVVLIAVSVFLIAYNGRYTQVIGMPIILDKWKMKIIDCTHLESKPKPEANEARVFTINGDASETSNVTGMRLSEAIRRSNTKDIPLYTKDN